MIFQRISSSPSSPRCVAVPDYYSDAELAVVNDALKLCDSCEPAGLLRHSSAVATAFGHSQGASLLPEGTEARTVGFVDVGSSHGTVSVVKFYRKDEAGAVGELCRCRVKYSDMIIYISTSVM